VSDQSLPPGLLHQKSVHIRENSPFRILLANSLQIDILHREFLKEEVKQAKVTVIDEFQNE
jgi:hypothetical protein